MVAEGYAAAPRNGRGVGLAGGAREAPLLQEGRELSGEVRAQTPPMRWQAVQASYQRD